MKHITPRELQDKLKSEQAIIVDVREPAEFRAEHIKNAYLIPQSEATVDKLPFKNKSVVFICRSGRRSAGVCERFLTHHPDIDAYSLSGGINAWKDAGYDVITSAEKVIPLERQIQIAAGSLVLIGVIAGYLITPSLYLLSGFVGCGLIFAGVTGWCGMAKILALMPWNK
jgi:rhodanese-related sulfurtransferase